MPPASTASFTTSTARRICRHCFAEAYVDVALENFPHHAGCPQLEKTGHGLEQLAEGRFANSYGEPPVLPRQAEGFVSCGRCPAITECARAGACGALIATSADPGGYDGDDDLAEKICEGHGIEQLAKPTWCSRCGVGAPWPLLPAHAQGCPVLADDDLALNPDRWVVDFDPETLTARPPAAIDPRRRTAPHGDPLEADATSVELLDADPEMPLSFRNFFGGAFGLEAFRGSFEIHPHQRRFIDLMERGEQPVLVPRRRSSSWPEAFRIVEGLLKEVSAPWRRDAEAAENGMGC